MSFAGLEHLFTPPKSYVVHRTTTPPVIDGSIQEPAWEGATWTESFTDIEGSKKPAPVHNTRVKMMWDDTHLFIAAQLEEPHVWATLRNHDEVVFYDNDFEVFIDPDNDTHQYFEIEVNAFNTIFDLFMPKPYRNNSGALIPWNAPGLKTAVKINGTINDPSDVDQGWQVEMAIPWGAISMGNNAHVPKNGDFWRINFSRVQWEIEVKGGKYVKKVDAAGKQLPENNWVWSPQGVINMHYPERWGYLQFTDQERPRIPAHLEYAEQQRNYLWLIYYRQKDYIKKHNKFAASLQELGIGTEVAIEGKLNSLLLESSGNLFRATVRGGGVAASIDDDGHVRTLK